MAGLFDKQHAKNRESAEPLASRMRPRSLDEFVGQRHFLGEGHLLRRLLKADRLQSLILYGPPGTGKTTLAHVISQETQSHFVALNAAVIGVKEVRQQVEAADARLARDGQKTILFVDELHHFSKTQQDVMLPAMEAGVVALIGATTSNPFFALNAALVSRSQILEFQPLSNSDIEGLIRCAMTDSERGLGNAQVSIDPDAVRFLAKVSDGDARRALNALEIAVRSVRESEGTANVDLKIAEQSVQKKAIRYDNLGDDHYDAASALIKSIRGSDPDAAVYWLARMLTAGEDPRFIARRLVIAASEDIGNADPHALPLAIAAARAAEFIGMPECRICLSQATTYLACAEKSNAAYAAINAAQKDVQEGTLIPVPVHLRDAHYAGAKRLNHGQDYLYPHASEEGWLDQDYLGVDRTYYSPTGRGHEQIFKSKLEELRKKRHAQQDSASEDQ